MSIIYGYGFEVHADAKTIADFVIKHKETIIERDEELELDLLERCEADSLDDLEIDFSEIECSVTEHTGIYAIIANIMTQETGIHFQYEESECDGNESILFAETYPWNLNDVEKNLTEEDLDKIVNMYVNELGIVTTTGYLCVEYQE